MRLFTIKRWMVLTLVVACCAAVSGDAFAAKKVNGRVEVRGDHTFLHLWGTHYEMGYAHGYLMSKEIMHLVNAYAGVLIPPALYQAARPAFEEAFSVPEPYKTEYQGILDGLRDSGVNMELEGFGKEIDMFDVVVCNAISDLSGLFNFFGCSTTIGWGDATATDPDFPRKLIACRDMDFTDTSGFPLANSSLVITYESSELDEQPWMSVAFPGYIGCLSGMNEDGLVAVQHVGNKPRIPDAGAKGVPINLAIRAGMEKRDYDMDGQATVKDVYESIRTHPRLGSYIIPVFGPYDPTSTEDPALVIEARYGDMIARYAKDDRNFPKQTLAATNHMRKLDTPTDCWRYPIIEQMLADNPQITKEEAWSIETAARQKSTIHTILFVPTAREVTLAIKLDSEVAPFRPRQTYKWEDLFPNHSLVKPEVKLWSRSTVYHGGETLRISQQITNTGYGCEVTVYTAVEVGGSLYFLPDFTTEPVGRPIRLNQGYTWTGDVIATTLPTGVKPVSMMWYSVLTDTRTGEPLGDVASIPCHIQ